MTFLTELNGETGLFDAKAMREKGKDLNAAYVSAQPFPHIMIEDFLPRPLIDLCIAEFSRTGADAGPAYDRSQERLKREIKPDVTSARVRNLFYAFNSRPFISLVENITGISGLIPDPYFMGGGFHEIQNGGHLSVHADFNHHKMMDLERRVNLLIYLNDDWQDSYGGQLELWENDMSACAHSFVPLANRCVIFNTTLDSNHGNPQVVNHPQGISRKSIALYYYTATWTGDKRARTTQFRPRAKTADRTDWQVKRQELLNDLVPPVILRNAARVGRRVRSVLGGKAH
jgi:hypothetical protein